MEATPLYVPKGNLVPGGPIWCPLELVASKIINRNV